MTQSLKSLPLFAGDPLPPSLPKGLKTPQSNRLWVAVHLPDRSPQAEHLELISLAHWVRRITPSVSLEPPHALLLEVSGSLKLWGGIDSIKKTLREEMQRRRLSAHLGLAPTALSALWSARHRQEDVLSKKELVGRLSGLPLRVTGWPDSVQLLLGKMGVRTIGDCLRLPREGLIRRVGKRCLDDLDKALGQHDIRSEFQPDQRLSSVLEFQEEVTEPEILANAGRRLIKKLTEALHKHQVQIESLEFGFQHLRKSKTVARIGLVVPTYELEKMTRLFQSKLETLSLPAPVTALSLTTGKIEPMVGLNSALFPARTQSALKAAMGGLIERLQTRFGAEDIYGVVLVEEHRPEAAWAKSMNPLLQISGAESNSPWNQRRPLWILPVPVQLSRTESTLHDVGQRPLQLESGPERIEAGWWEGQDASRDYYIASGSKGEKLWVYRDRCSDRSWYLHGIFG